MSLTGEEIYARTYDSTNVGWPGELAAYRRWARQAATGRDARVLELACGTGRVAIALADDGCDVTGVDLSAPMIDAARRHRPGGNPRWQVGDMRNFDLGRRFDIALIPAHAFQYMLSPDDQVAALRTVHRHLERRGRLVVHLDRPGYAWMASLALEPADRSQWTVGEPCRDEVSGLEWRRRFVWTIDPTTDVVTFHREWMRLDASGSTLESIPQEPLQLKVIGRAEMEHALARSGFEVEALLGAFDESLPAPTSGGEMIWLARRIN